MSHSPLPTSSSPATDSKCTTPRASSPHKPSTSTPSKGPVSLSSVDDEDFSHFTFGSPRGHSQSCPQTPLPTTSSCSHPNPDPNPSTRFAPNVAPLSSLSLPVTFDAMLATFRDPPQPSSPNREAVERPSLLSSHLASSWWGGSEYTPRPWKDSPKRKKLVPPEQTVGWELTRTRVAQAAKSALGATSDVTHELLELSVDLLGIAPIPALRIAAITLLNIWDAVEQVDMNRLGCLRLTDRCADILSSVRREISDAGDTVGQELATPIIRLEGSFTNVHTFLDRQINRPFLKRYLKRDEIIKEMERCDADLRDALSLFSLSIQIRILSQISKIDRQRAREIQDIVTAILPVRDHPPSNPILGEEPEAPIQTTSLLSSRERSSNTITHLTDTVAPTPTTFTFSALPATVPKPSEVLLKLESYHRQQNSIDAEHDLKDLRHLMSAALQETSDAQMLEMLQIGRPEMPDAIKTLQRALERLVEKEQVEEQGEGRESVVVEQPPRGVFLGKGVRRASVEKDGTANRAQTYVNFKSPNTSTASRTRSIEGIKRRRDTLDREFIESGIDALRRMSRGMETNLPSWTITRYEVDRESKIGIGFFSYVYKGTWRGRTVAVKILTETTSQELFVREIEIWKGLRHDNVLPLYGASSANGEAPWFFVSPYLKNGSLVEFLKRVEMESLGGRMGLVDGRNSFPCRAAGEGRVMFGRLRGTLPAGKVREVPEEWDLLQFMYEIAKGMEYLHSQRVLHGDLKAANVLVDDKICCVISDFGQSEMRSEVFRKSGTPPPHGTLRWQAPELLYGQSQLTAEMDVYAFSICCVEVLSMGRMPWPLLDDDAVRHLVLTKDSRPSLYYQDSRYTTTGVQELLRVCWHRDPMSRPAFSKIVGDIEQLKAIARHVDLEPSQIQLSPLVEDLEPRTPASHMRPISSPDVRLRSHPNTEITYHTTRDSTRPLPPSRVTHQAATNPNIQLTSGNPVTNASSGPLRDSPTFLSPSDRLSEDNDNDMVDDSEGYNSPLGVDERIAKMNERQYRYLLTHEYNASLTVPLWSPSPVDLGAVGYLSKKRPGRFITLFNALRPLKSNLSGVRNLPSIYGYGEVKEGRHRKDKRSRLQRWLDAVTGLLAGFTFRSRGDMVPQVVSRRYTYPLKAGQSIAILCAESTDYHYIENLEAPKKWFQLNVDSVMNIYGTRCDIQKEDLFLVVGTLRARNYAMSVSHSHPSGHAQFSVYSSPQTGHPWGTFTTDPQFTDEGRGPLDDAEPSDILRQSACKVSGQGGPSGTLLLARLRFKPDHLEPTSM